MRDITRNAIILYAVLAIVCYILLTFEAFEQALTYNIAICVFYWLWKNSEKKENGVES